jgi:hypothetical protein
VVIGLVEIGVLAAPRSTLGHPLGNFMRLGPVVSAGCIAVVGLVLTTRGLGISESFDGATGQTPASVI